MIPKVQSKEKTPLRYFSGNLAFMPLITLVGEPGPTFNTAGKLSGYSEFIYRKAESQDYQYGLGTGLVYAINDRAQLDASVGVDLDGDVRSYNGGLGVSVLF